MTPNDPLVRITIYGPRPGSGDKWLVAGHDPTGVLVINALGARAVVIAALAEYVESLHAVDLERPRWPWL